LFWFFISTEPKKLPCDQISHPDRRAVFLYMYHGKNFHYGIYYHPSVINAYLKINTMEMIQVRTFTSDAFAVKSLIRQYMIWDFLCHCCITHDHIFWNPKKNVKKSILFFHYYIVLSFKKFLLPCVFESFCCSQTDQLQNPAAAFSGRLLFPLNLFDSNENFQTIKKERPHKIM